MGLRKFTGEVVKEGKRVRWPKRDVLVPAILVVVIISVISALILFGEDVAGRRLLDVLKDSFGGN